MCTTRILTAILAMSIVCVACGGGDDGEEAPSSDLEVDVAPVTEGDWYRPEVATTWQWQLSGTIDTSVDVDLYDVDLFDTSAETIAALQAEGRAVICYFSGGSSESWRPDFGDFDALDMGDELDGWEGERWLDVRSANVLAIMEARLDLAVDKGCDGVEPDNMDGYANDSGFDLTADDQLAYNRAIGNMAHAKGLSVGLKNDLGQIPALVAYFDFQINEECHQFGECADTLPFIEAGKPVFNAEYPEQWDATPEAVAAEICPQALAADIRTLILPLLLDASYRLSCDD